MPAKAVARAVVKQERKVEKKANKSSTGIGAMLGGAAGSLFGHPALGSALGNLAEGLIGKLFGSGDYVEVPYSVNNNTVTGDVNVMSQQLPAFSGGGLMTRIVHREFIADYGMTSAFALTQLLLYPGDTFVFPWLSGIVTSFQKYKWKGLVFELRSTSANAVASSVAGMGSAFAMTQYDVYANAPVSKPEIMNSYFSVSGKPSESILIPIECDPTTIPANPLYVTHGIVLPDLHWYSMGTLNIGTQGATSNYTGAWELWVSYDIELYEPCVPIPNPEAPEGKAFFKSENVDIGWARTQLLRSASARLPPRGTESEGLIHVARPTSNGPPMRCR